MAEKNYWNILLKEYIEQFVSISPEEWEAMLPLLTEKKLARGDYYNTPGNKSIRMGFIIKGILRTYFIADSGNEYTTDFCSVSNVTANYEIINSQFSEDYYTQALTETILLEIDYANFEQLCKKDTVWEEFKVKQVEYYYNLKIKREKELLSLSAEEKYEKFVDKYKSILDKIPQYAIASYLGITPETLSRIKKNR